MMQTIFLMLLLPLFVQSVAAQNSPPNIIFILTDDQSYASIGYNNPEVQTPFLDSLAREGIIFQNAYVATPICAASRASILTGLFPQQHKVIALNSQDFTKDIVENPNYNTLPQIMAGEGYSTAFYGKSHLGDPKSYGFDQGEQIREDSTVFEASKNFIQQSSQNNRPFFLWIATHQPHLPLLPPQEWLSQYDTANISLPVNFREFPIGSSLVNQGLPGEQYFRDSEYTRNAFKLPGGPPRDSATMKQFIRAYYATISHLDEQISVLFETLKNEGLDKKTFIIYLSDNGYFLGNHGLGNKITMHEESTRVPMFIWSKDLKNPGTETNALISSLDIFNTALSLAGIKAPGYLMGKDVSPLFVNPHKKKFRRYVVSECVGVGGKRGEGHRMVRSGEWKYMLSGINEEGLFNLKDDPYELHNLAENEQYQQRLQTMRGYLREWMQQVDDEHQLPPTH